MGDVLPLILCAANSILLAKYYSAFLTPKSGKIPSIISFAAFGAAYFFAQFGITSMLAEADVNTAAFCSALVLLVLVFALSIALFKNNLRLCIFLAFSFFATQEVSQFVLLSISNALGNAHRLAFDYLIINSYLTLHEDIVVFTNAVMIFQFVALAAIYASIITITLRIIKKSFIYKNHALSPSELSYLILPCFSGLSTTFIMRALLIQIGDYGIHMMFNEVPFINFIVPIAGFLIIFSMVATVKFFQRVVQSYNDERDRAVLQKQEEQLQKQISDVDGIYSEIRGVQHDMRGHISNILALVNAVLEGNNDVISEFEEYFGKFSEALNKFDFVFQTGNSISDVIIHQKYLDAVNAGIAFTADFNYPNRLNLDTYDLAVILSNALENAIEACSGMTQADRFIRLYAYTKGEMFFVEIENSFEKAIVLDKNTGLLESGKQDKNLHGMGLSNIQRCARKYFGDIDYQVTETKNCNIFRLTVMLQGRD